MPKNGKRESTIVRTSIVGILVNVALAAVKAAVGLMSNSIAVVLDSLNNVSDALSSVITIVGTKLALKPATKKHPFGHGRTEYLSALIIAVIVLYAGMTSAVESVKKIINPTEPSYSAAGISFIAVAVAVKIALGLYFKSVGKSVRSNSLVASGQDALMDSVVSASTVAAALVFKCTGFRLEAWLALVISALIIKSGLALVAETVSQILGERIDPELSRGIKETVCGVDGDILGAYDLVLNNYGPDRFLGSVHIEVPSDWTAEKIDIVTRRIQDEVFRKHSVVLGGVGIYSVNSGNSSSSAIRVAVEKAAETYPEILQTHGFFADVQNRRISFDVVVAFGTDGRRDAYERFCRQIRNLFPGYEVSIHLDADMSD